MKVVESLGTHSSSTRKALTITRQTFCKLSLLYLALPVMIFFYGYLRFLWALLFSSGLIVSIVFATRSFDLKDKDIAQTNEIELRPSFLVFTVLVTFLIVYWGGIGEFANCTSDHRVRYAILNDLVEYKWPVIYDFSTQQNPVISANLGSGTVAFSYYFVFWMIPALVGKVFGLLAARIALCIWSGLGIFLLAIGSSLFYKRASKALFVFLFLFSGFDIIPYVINRITNTPTTWEGWNQHLFIHGNFYQIMNVFNQSIPGWLITLLLLMSTDSRSLGLLGGLMFCYSPWATIGLLPMCICRLLITSRSSKGGESPATKTILGNICTFSNILPPIIFLAVFGSIYTANPNATGANGWIWNFYDSPWGLVKDYIAYFIFEFGIWFFLIVRKHKHDPMLWISFVTLLIMPIYKISIANDFIMRGSMAPMFLISLYCTMYISDQFEACRNNNLPRKQAITGRVILIIMIIAAYIPANLILGSALITYQMHFTDIVNYEDETSIIGSFGNIIEERELETVKNQFFVYDYEDSVFFKYFAK